MKKFVNKLTDITTTDVSGVIKQMSFAEIAILTLDIIPHGGWTRKEMSTRFRIEDKLKNHGKDDIVELDDADVEKLKELANLPWQFKHRDILAYQDHLEELLK